MPFCTQCGAQVQPADVFCSKCGMRQAAPGPVPRPDPLAGITPRTASMLCYVPIVGWIASIVVLASPKFRNERDVRFHAFQGLYLFVVWLLVDWVVAPFWHALPGGHSAFKSVAGILHMVVFGAWIWMILKTAQEQMVHLPIVGDLAERSLAEQL
jgi:uncharacterized membrane protein